MNIRITIYSVFFVVLISSASFGAWKHVSENGSENTHRLKLWSNFEQRYTLISGQDGCDDLPATKSGRAHCKLGYYLGRAHASLGILGSVIPNCINSSKHQSFFSNYGEYLLKEGSHIIGMVRAIDNDRTEDSFGKGWGELNNTMLTELSETMYYTIKQQFSAVDGANLPNVCENFHTQIRSGDLGVAVYINQYLIELKNSYPEDYQEAQDLITRLIDSLQRLENAKKI